MSRRALYITTRLFWPADSGRKVSLYHYCQGMHEQLGCDVHLFSFLEGDQTPEMADAKPDFLSSVTVAAEIGLPEKAANLSRALLDGSMPLQCCLFQSRENRRLLSEAVASIDPDVAIIDMVRLAPYIGVLKEAGVPAVVNFDDLLSKRYARQLGGTGGNVLGQYDSDGSSLLGKLVNGLLRRAVLGSEAKRVARAEDRYGRLADACLFVSPAEANELDARIGGGKCFSATMGAEVTEFAVDTERRYDFGFVGNMSYSANQDSLRFLVDEVLPLLPNATLRVIGACSEQIEQEYADYNNVSFTGWVDSIAENLRQCTALLAPFAYGSGIKTKVLEAMGMGIPVVTNSIGLEGIDAERGRDVLCADTPKGLAREAERLLSDAGLRERVSEAGRGYVVRNHTWEKSIADLGKCLEHAVDANTKAGRQK